MAEAQQVYGASFEIPPPEEEQQEQQVQGEREQQLVAAE